MDERVVIGDEAEDLVPPRRLLSRAEVSVWLGVPESTLRQWAYRGLGPRFHKVGKHARYEVEAVREWLAEREKP